VLLSIFNLLFPGAALLWRRQTLQGCGYMVAFGFLSASHKGIGVIWALYLLIMAQIHFHKIRRSESAKGFAKKGKIIIWVITALMLALYCLTYGAFWPHGFEGRFRVTFFFLVVASLLWPAILLTFWLEPNMRNGTRGWGGITMGALCLAGGIYATYALFAASWLRACLIYFGVGIIWICFDLNRRLRPTRRALYGHRMSSLLMVLAIWPSRAIIAAREDLRQLFDPTRFRVTCGEFPARQKSDCRTWKEAILIACERAHETNAEAFIYDSAVDRGFIVSPEGNLELSEYDPLGLR